MLARSMFVLAMLGSAAPAWAFGIGTTAGIGAGGALFGGGPGTGRAVGSTWSGFLPSLDLHFGDIALQIHVLETIAGIASEDFFLGANVYFGIPVGTVADWDVIIAPGAGLDLWLTDPFGVGVTAEAQFGLTRADQVSVGIYIVPALGFAFFDGDAALAVGGTLQLSIWFGVGGGKGGGGGESAHAVGTGGADEGV